MSKLMSEIPTEKENFLRFFLFFIDVGTETVLKVFYHYQRLRPTIVTFPIGENRKLRRALPNAWYRNVIEERGPDILDISILIKLLQTLFSEVLQAPLNGWGGDLSGDFSVSADLERLRRIRNDIVAHPNQASLTSICFDYNWEQVETILRRLVKEVDPNNQTKLEETFKEYRQKTIGAFYAKKCRDYLTKQIDEINQMIKDFSLLGKDKQYTPFLRYIKLLVDGGRLFFTAYLNKLIKDNNSSLRSTLLEKKVEVLEELGGHQAMKVQVYPNNEKVDTNTTHWDLSVIAKVIVSVCTSSVDVDDIDAIKAVREAREKYAYTALYAITSDKKFHDECEDLILNLSHLARSIGGNATQEFIHLKAVYRSPSEMASEEVDKYLNELKRPGFDIKEIKDIHKECVGKLRTKVSTIGNIDFNVNENFELELMIQIACQDNERQNEAESILYNVIKDIIADPQGKREESPVLPEVRQTLDTIRGIPTVRLTCVKKSCLLITVESNSSEDLMTLVDYVDSSKFQNQLNGISTELEDMFDEVFILKGHFTLESIQQTLVRIERNTENNSVIHDDDSTQASEIITTYEYMAQDTKKDIPAQGETIIYDRGESDKTYQKTTESESETEIWQELRQHQRRLFRDSDLLEGHLEQAIEAYKSLRHGILQLTDEMQKIELQLKVKESWEEEKQNQHIVELLKPLEDLRYKVEKEIDRSQQIRLETFGLKEVKMEFESLLERAEQNNAELKECSFQTDFPVGG